MNLSLNLPPPNLEVVPPCHIFAYPRSPTNYIKALLQLGPFDKRYIKDALGTYCNRLVHDACMVTGASLPRENGWPMLANRMVAYLGDTANGWQKMAWQDAVTNALYGCPTVTGLAIPDGHGHVAMVLPATAVNMVDILTVQAGATNFYGRSLGVGFGLKHLPNVVFFGHP